MANSGGAVTAYCIQLSVDQDRSQAGEQWPMVWGSLGFSDNTGWGKGRLTIVRMENNTIIN